MNQYLEQLKNFNYKELNNTNFKEAAVCEALVLPLLNALGYSYTGDFKIVREKRIEHPFNVIGSKKNKSYVYPDYTLEYKGRALCIVEVKSPSESVQNEEYISQAYSYAIHREVAAKYYCLCNGNEFVLYCTDSFNPILKIQFENIEKDFDMLNHIIGTNYILKDTKKTFSKDLGIHLKMTCGDDMLEHQFLIRNTPIDVIMKVNENTYTVSNDILVDGEFYCASFDFSSEQLIELKPYMQGQEYRMLCQENPGSVVLKNLIETDMRCKLSENIIENENEYYIPLVVCEFISPHRKEI